ncbi:hypothetical protein GCM10009839_32400 [Catenulispora yoronensis]|uniref:Protein kinase domain-containing protein n=2 Tax=Catenulispora yoronensis TaxID=450799 RepID=A0ABP5FQ54_9ACTN
MEPLSPNDPQVVGRYRLLGRLGSGGMGIVYLGQSPGGRLVAVKCVHRELAGDAEFRRRFARESAAARLVGGFHTAPVVDADPDGDPPWLVTAYIPGLTLAEAVAAAGGALPEATVRALGAGLAEALEAIHSTGLVHRDLKPSNVLITDDGPRVIDFGIARALDDTALTRSHMIVGTPGFSSPEQLTGAQVGPASDVFCLGLVLCHAGGVPPFGRGNHEALLYRIVHQEAELGGVPEDLRAVVERCLAKDPAGRPTAAELLERWSMGPVAASAWLPEAVATRIAAVAHGAPAAAPEHDEAAPTLPAEQSTPPTEQPAPPAEHSAPPTEQPAPPTEQSEPLSIDPTSTANTSVLTPPSTPPPAIAAPATPSRRRVGVLSAVTAVALAAAGTGVYFALNGSNDSSSNRGSNSAALGPIGDSSNQVSTTTSSSAPAAGSSSKPPAAAAPSAAVCATGTLIGAGSGAHSDALNQAVKDYQTACAGATVNYLASGSGAGLTAFTSRQADFAVVDAPLSATQQTAADQRCGSRNKALTVMSLANAIWVVAHLPGAENAQLNLSPSTLAKIFAGTITTWNDPAIAHDNPSLTLPNLQITTIHRSDASSASYDFSAYLHGSAPSDFAQDPNKTWPGTGGNGFSGSAGVADAARATVGSIAYMDEATAIASGFQPISLNHTAPTDGTVGSFLSSSAVDTEHGNVVPHLSYANVPFGQYPLVSINYAVVCDADNNPGMKLVLQGFLSFLVSQNEQASLAHNNFSEAPAALLAQAATTFTGLK